VDLEEGSRDLEESIPRKKAKVDDPLSRIDPYPPLVEEGSRDLEESIPRKKAKVDDPLSRIDPSHHLSNLSVSPVRRSRRPSQRVTTVRSNKLARVRRVIWQAVLWNLEKRTMI
jgi:hypothetical protein